MKTISNIVLSCVFFLFGILNGLAKATPPAPNGKTTNGPPPPPPGLPINDHLFYLIVFAVFFGIYIVYKRKQDNKIWA